MCCETRNSKMRQPPQAQRDHNHLTHSRSVCSTRHSWYVLLGLLCARHAHMIGAPPRTSLVVLRETWATVSPSRGYRRPLFHRGAAPPWVGTPCQRTALAMPGYHDSHPCFVSGCRLYAWLCVVQGGEHQRLVRPSPNHAPLHHASCHHASCITLWPTSRMLGAALFSAFPFCRRPTRNAFCFHGGRRGANAPPSLAHR